MAPADVFKPWMERWNLVADGPAFESQSRSRLLPVLSGGQPAMLKVARGEEARRGAELMAWWGGDGAAKVLERDGPVLLTERATGDRDLAAMACAGEDDEALRIVCGVVAKLHAPRSEKPPELVPLSVFFGELEPAARRHGGVLTRSAQSAAALFAAPRESIPLHGDIHHRNILDGGARGWIAIDARGLMGERAFDYANLFNNPDIDSAHDPSVTLAAAPGVLERRVRTVAEVAGIEPKRMLQWIIAFSGLAAAWMVEYGWGSARLPLAIVEIAAAALDA